MTDPRLSILTGHQRAGVVHCQCGWTPESPLLDDESHAEHVLGLLDAADRRADIYRVRPVQQVEWGAVQTMLGRQTAEEAS